MIGGTPILALHRSLQSRCHRCARAAEARPLIPHPAVRRMMQAKANAGRRRNPGGIVRRRRLWPVPRVCYRAFEMPGKPLLLTPACALLAAAQVLELGSRRELFVDHWLIERMAGAELRLAQPVDAGVALRLDAPWEGPFSGYFTVLKDGPLYRLYYRGLPAAGADGNAREVTCYAESRDGVHWIKPKLGMYEINGHRDNNVILAGQPPFSHNFSPFLDTHPSVAPAERYKALAGTSRSGLYAFVSADGIRWRRWREEAVIPAPDRSAFDSQNVAFWSESEGCYICYFRSWKRIGEVNYRWISRTTSSNFLDWSPPVQMSFGDAPAEHLYTNQTSPYFRAPHIYLGICARFFPGRQVLSPEQAAAIQVDPKYYQDCSDAVLITSRGGERYERTFLEAFLRPGPGWENWVSRSNYPALNIVPTGEGEMSFYVARNYGQPTAHLRRYRLRLDGIASLHAGYRGGEALTKPLRFRGRRLLLNYATSAAGSVAVEIQEASGVALPGFSLAEARELIGDEIEAPASWRAGSDLAPLEGRTIRLRIRLKDADLYALRFQP